MYKVIEVRAVEIKQYTGTSEVYGMPTLKTEKLQDAINRTIDEVQDPYFVADVREINRITHIIIAERL